MIPAAGSAQDFTIGLMGGIGGATDAEPDTGFDNTGFQLLFAMETDLSTRFSARLGQLDLDSSDNDFFQADLSYLTLSGEYMQAADYYESGLFVGLGYYQIDGNLFTPDDDSLGLNVGASGDFRITDRFSVLAEFSIHYADLEIAQFFAMAHIGVGFRF